MCVPPVFDQHRSCRSRRLSQGINRSQTDSATTSNFSPPQVADNRSTTRAFCKLLPFSLSFFFFKALWVVEPERRHDLYDMHYGYYYDDDIGGGWGEFRAAITRNISMPFPFQWSTAGKVVAVLDLCFSEGIPSSLKQAKLAPGCPPTVAVLPASSLPRRGVSAPSSYSAFLPRSRCSASLMLPLTPPSAALDGFPLSSGGGLKELRADLPSGDFHGFVEKFKGECWGWARLGWPCERSHDHRFSVVRVGGWLGGWMVGDGWVVCGCVVCGGWMTVVGCGWMRCVALQAAGGPPSFQPQ